jgi:hypothetical protein
MPRDVDADYLVAQWSKLDPGKGPGSDEDCAKSAGNGERADHSAAHDTSLR